MISLAEKNIECVNGVYYMIVYDTDSKLQNAYVKIWDPEEVHEDTLLMIVTDHIKRHSKPNKLTPRFNMERAFKFAPKLLR